MKKYHILSLAASFFFAIASLLVPQTALASTLFLDQFNGTGELHSYNNYWDCSNVFQENTCSGLAGGMYVDGDHVYTSGFDPAYLYTGVQASDNVCGSIDFNWANGGDWVAILLHGSSDRVNTLVYIESPSRYPPDGEWYVYTNQFANQFFQQYSYNPTGTHTLKACVSGSTLTGYLDGNQMFSMDDAVDAGTGSYVGFAAQYYTGFLDNFKIETVNQPPQVGTISVSPNPVQINNATTASANFTDADTTDTHTATWDWGDGTPTNPDITTGTVTESNGSGSVSDNHTYTTAGVYPVTLTVTDNGGATGSSTFQYVSVYNPTAQGLFTAGQHFSSPAGAYSANTSLTGTVKFGLSYKYQGTMPVGDRQFTMNFGAANLTFNATTINSLVIANGMATLTGTGTGTINGSSATYNFLVTGVNGGGIRIQITDPSNNNAVIYDTQPGDPATATPTTSVTGNVIAHN